MRARELGRRSVVVGDRVALVGDVSGTPGSLARIVRIEPRSSVLRRTAEDDSAHRPSGGDSVPLATERIIVANADQIVVVCSLVDPPPRTGFIDRCLVAAYDADIRPLLCLTKADLPGADDAAATLDGYYADLTPDSVRCRPDAPLDELESRLAGRLSVLIGHSGVGKSTLVNRLVPGAGRAVGRVSAIGKGRHTSTSMVALPLADADGWLVDTPGIRSFGLAHVSAQSLLHGFPDLAPATAHCPPGCDHTEGAPGCGLDRLVAADDPDGAGRTGTASRLASYRRLLASRNRPTGT